jgi:hypothetical protein
VINRAAQVGGGALVRTVVADLAGALLSRPLVIGGMVALTADALYYTVTGRRFIDAAKLMSWAMGAVGMASLGLEGARPSAPATIPEYGTGIYPQPTGQNPCQTISVVRQETAGYGDVFPPAGFSNWHQITTQTGIQRWFIKVNSEPCPSKAREDLPAIPVTRVHEQLDPAVQQSPANKELLDAVGRGLASLLPQVTQGQVGTLPVPAADPPGVTVGDFFTPRPALFPPGTPVTVEFKDPQGQELPDPTPGTEPEPGGGTPGTSNLVKIDTAGEPNNTPDEPPELPQVADWLNPLKAPFGPFLAPGLQANGALCQPLGSFDLAGVFGLSGNPTVLDFCPVAMDPRFKGVIDLICTAGPPIAAASVVLKA